jgi:hypothetical protein
VRSLLESLEIAIFTVAITLVFVNVVGFTIGALVFGIFG